MWRQREVKANARVLLKKNYWLAFSVCILAEFLTAVSSSVVVMNRLAIQFQLILPAALIMQVAFFSILYTIFITNPVRIGLKHFFLANQKNEESFSRLFAMFSKKSYVNVIKISLIRDVYILLWALLFIIPGFIKYYETFFVPYILAENPELSKERAFEISKLMTKNDKINIFILQMYFVVLEVLGAVLLVVGAYFVLPYKEATFVELYALKREEVLKYGRITNEELCGIYSDKM